jgi:hypothetical protein
MFEVYLFSVSSLIAAWILWLAFIVQRMIKQEQKEEVKHGLRG